MLFAGDVVLHIILVEEEDTLGNSGAEMKITGAVYMYIYFYKI